MQLKALSDILSEKVRQSGNVNLSHVTFPRAFPMRRTFQFAGFPRLVVLVTGWFGDTPEPAMSMRAAVERSKTVIGELQADRAADRPAFAPG